MMRIASWSLLSFAAVAPLSRRQDLGETPLECLFGYGAGVDHADDAIGPDKHRRRDTDQGVQPAHPALFVEQHRKRHLELGDELADVFHPLLIRQIDRKSTRLNSSHSQIS